MSPDDRLLVIWRHADAGEPIADPALDLRRELSRKGRRQARLTAQWLRRHLPETFRLITSPAPRAMQTACELAQPEPDDSLLPGACVQQALDRRFERLAPVVVLVGHQPQLGGLVQAYLDPARVQGESALSVRKSTAWCLRLRGVPNDESVRVQVVGVFDPAFAQ